MLRSKVILQVVLHEEDDETLSALVLLVQVVAVTVADVQVEG